RINLYRRGPYFCEVHWFDVRVADERGKAAPLKGDLALYCYPDKILASITWHATKDFAASSIAVHGKTESAFTPEPFTAGSIQSFAFPLFGETPPLPETAFENINAKTPMRYDTVRGCYTIGSLSEGGFQGHFYHHPNRYETASFRVTNDAAPRTIYVCHENVDGDKGSVEGGVLLDESGHPLPIVVQISKNFAGEKEEPFYNPEDTAFSETYFPLTLDANESRALTSLKLYQNWGNHMLKQFSSLGAWMDYFHSSTGVTETTCYVPFKFGGLDGVDIADFRAMSQHAFWSGQPQHDNVAGHSFLSFTDGSGDGMALLSCHGGDSRGWRYLEYRGTTYRGTGPNWMDIGFEYLSTDGSIRAVVDSVELPQADELRQFVHVRYDVLKPVTIPAARENFRLLTAASYVQKLRQTRFAATGMDDTELIFRKNHFGVLGHPLPSENAFLAVYGEPQGGNAFVLRRWESSVGGASVGPAASVYCERSGDTRLLLVANAEDLTLNPGDWFDFEAILMPFGSCTDADAPRREAVTYGAEGPRVTAVTQGVKVRDFPAEVRAESNRAEFTIQGGRDLVPIVVTGLSDYRWPRIECKGERDWIPVSHARVGALDGVQTFCAEDGSFGAVFLVHSDNTPQTLRVTAGVEPPATEAIRVTAFRAPEDGQGPAGWQHSAQIQAPWMDTPIFLRYPETVYTDGLDFIDHRRDDMPPRVDPGPLARNWNESEGGSIWFEWEYDNQTAGGRLSPNVDSVDLECWLDNRRDAAVNFGLQFCPALAGTLFEDRTYERTWGLFGGQWRRLCDMDRGEADPSLCHYRVAGGPDFNGDSLWGKSADVLDRGMVAITSPDGQYVFAIVWPDCMRVLTNGGIPCVHADPPAYPVPPKKRLHIRGKVYLMKGTLDDLLARVRREIDPLERNE
ncbi:MAG: hypothetical protein QG656_975, partial [Candidatus Hydrogenedentes bacterium]|nr:hypothetical protein [Candidatus Hydrogenedentota bacterium]